SNCRLYGYVKNLPELMAQSRVSISQAGYNTVTESVLTETPMILVPFANGREDEQTRRAKLFSEQGMAIHLPEQNVSAASLRSALASARKLPPTSSVDTNGAEVSARHLSELSRQYFR
ncbi:MAG: glycosyltransferase, partial [Pseudomonadota bacterium]